MIMKTNICFDNFFFTVLIFQLDFEIFQCHRCDYNILNTVLKKPQFDPISKTFSFLGSLKYYIELVLILNFSIQLCQFNLNFDKNIHNHN